MAIPVVVPPAPPQPSTAPTASPAPSPTQAAPSGSTPAVSTPAPTGTPSGNGVEPVKIYPKGGSDAFAALEALGDGPTPAPNEPEPSSEPEPETTPTEPSPTAPKPASTPAQPDKPVKTAELRKNYDLLKAENAKLKKEFEEYKATPRDDPEKAKLAEDLKARQAKIEELENHRKELQTELMYSNYERSEDFKEKYWKPYEKAWKEGAALVSQLQVVERTDPESGDVVQKARPATAEDFVALMRELHPGTAAKMAASMFGEQYPIAMHHWARVHEANNAKREAVETFQKDGAKIHQERMEAFSKEEKEISEHWKTRVSADAERYPRFFKDDPNDPQATEILQKGRYEADRAFFNGKPVREGDKPMNRKELAELQAVIYNKAAGFDLLVHRFAALKKELKAKTDALAKYESSTPKGGLNGRREITPAKPATAIDAFTARFGA